MCAEEGADALLHAARITDEWPEPFPRLSVLGYVGDLIETEDARDIHKQPTIDIEAVLHFRR